MPERQEKPSSEAIAQVYAWLLDPNRVHRKPAVNPQPAKATEAEPAEKA